MSVANLLVISEFRRKKMITEFRTKKIPNSGMMRISGQGILGLGLQGNLGPTRMPIFFKVTRWNSERYAQLFDPERN